MKPGIQTAFPLMLMALLAALTFWLARLMQTDTPVADSRQRHDPDYQIEKFTVRRFDHNGNLQHELSAERMTHYPDNDATELTQPRLVGYAGPSPVHASARRGTVGREGSVVVLRDEVRIHRDPAPGVPRATFTTTEATVYPDDEYVTTAAPVTLTQGNSIASGVGFELNNKTLQTVMHSNVRATYLKEKP